MSYPFALSVDGVETHRIGGPRFDSARGLATLSANGFRTNCGTAQ